MNISEETRLQEEQCEVAGSRSVLFAIVHVYSSMTETSRCVYKVVLSTTKSVTEISSKASEYSFKDYNCSIHVCLSSQWGKLLKERICSCRSKFFLLRVSPIVERLHCPGNQTGTCQNCLHLFK